MTPDQAVVWVFSVFISAVFVVRSEDSLVRRFFIGVLIGDYIVVFLTIFAHIVGF